MDRSFNNPALKLLGFHSFKRFFFTMNDRIHFCISSSIICLMISFVFWSRVPATSHSVAIQEPVSEDQFEETIYSFLDREKELAIPVAHHPVSTVSEPVSFSEPISLASEDVNLKTYIPLNVVPELKKAQSKQTHDIKQKSISKPKTNKAKAESRSVISKPTHSKPHVVSREVRKHLERTENRANQLIRQSQDSFSRGLISLVDYNLALNIAIDSNVKAAEIRQTKDGRLPLLIQKQEMIQKAAEQLENFGQPASRGWYGDVIHAKLILAQNQYEIAKESKDSDRQQAALDEISKISSDYYAVRKAELQVGEADLTEFRRASRSIFVASQERNLLLGQDQNDTTGFANYARSLEDIKSEVEWLSDKGAGLGRSDLLDLSQSELSYTQGKYYLKSNQKDKGQKMLTDSMQYAKAAWSTRIDTYYPVGTASLHDISKAWIMWKAAETEVAELMPNGSTTSDRELKLGLDRMVSTADSIKDRRGRNACDISLVHCLKDSSTLSELEQKQIK